MRTPQVSIILPVYNVADYIRNCIDSIRCQTFTNFEVLVIDDGSTDESISIAKSMAGDDGRFRFFQQSNQGLGPARNLGIEHAKSDYLCFIDSDDYVDGNYVKYLYDAVLESGAEMATCRCYLVNKDGDIINELPKHIPVPNNSYVEAIPDLLTGRVSTAAWCKIYKKNLFTRIRFPKGYYEDMIMLVELLLCNKVQSIQHVKMPLYFYVIRSSSITNNFDKKYIRDCSNAVKKVGLLLKEHNQYIQKEYCFFYCLWRTTIISGIALQPDKQCYALMGYLKNYTKDSNLYTLAVIFANKEGFPLTERKMMKIIIFCFLFNRGKWGWVLIKFICRVQRLLRY